MATAKQPTSRKLYRTLHDQLDAQLYPAAFKTCNRILRADPADPLAQQTKLQLLVALDRFPDALHEHSTDALTQAYCLYKLGRAGEAATALEAEDDDDRAVQVMRAQVDYRLGEYERSRDLFDDLAATAEADSPEAADLQHNSTTCTSHLDFLSSVFTTLNSSSSAAQPHLSIEELESRPLALVLPSAPRQKATLIATAAAASTRSTTGGPRARRPAKHFDPSRQPAEDRWIPKRQRPSMREALLQAKEKARGKKKERVALTQGAAAAEPAAPATPAKQGGAGGGGGGKAAGKKKKGKK
ncbi:hypothetical protein JCM1841_001773 [Sporobolomyces salmonicolor]